MVISQQRFHQGGVLPVLQLRGHVGHQDGKAPMTSAQADAAAKQCPVAIKWLETAILASLQKLQNL